MLRKILIRKKSARTCIYLLCGLFFLLFVRSFYSSSSEVVTKKKTVDLSDNSQLNVQLYRKTRYEQYAAIKTRSGPGENGAAVILSGEEKQEADRLFEKEAFNIVASDKIALDRTIPDTRDPA